MQITIDTNGTLSDTDLQILGILAGREAYQVDSSRTVVTEPAEVPTPAPAKRPAPAKAKPAPEPEVVEEPEEDLLGEDESVTREHVVEVATQMAAAGDGAKIRAALKAVGAGKVREVPDEKLQTFFDALQSA